jgi:ribosomal protein S17E
MSFNLNSLALRDTTTLKLRHPVTDEVLADDEGNEVIVHLYGTASKQYRNAIAALQNRAMKRKAKGKEASPDEIREEAIGVLVACSDRIDNLTYNDAPVDNDEAFRKLYSDPSMEWIKGQIDSVIGDYSAFLGQ